MMHARDCEVSGAGLAIDKSQRLGRESNPTFLHGETSLVDRQTEDVICSDELNLRPWPGFGEWRIAWYDVDSIRPLCMVPVRVGSSWRVPR